MGPAQTTKRHGSQARRDFLWPLGLLALGTIPFLLSDLDRQVQALFYRDGEWFLADFFLFRGLYDWGSWPAALTAALGMAAWLLGFIQARLARWRKAAAALFLALLLGPGLLVNAALKDHWGRPRPVMVEEFGGTMPFERVLSRDPASSGKSFPCGHATMGYYFILAAMMLRRKSRLWSGSVMAGAMILGSVIGLARIAQGGHFLSDVVWAWGLIWLVSSAVYHGLGLERSFWSPVPAADPRRARVVWLRATVAPASAGVLFLAALATPHRGEERWELPAPPADEPGELSLWIDLAEGDLFASAETPPGIFQQTSGHALPGSRLLTRVTVDEGDGEPVVRARQRIRGHFTELNARTTLHTGDRALRVRAEIVGSGSPCVIVLPALSHPQRWTLEIDRPQVVVKAPPGIRVEARLRDREGDREVEGGSGPLASLDLRCPGGRILLQFPPDTAEAAPAP